MDAIESVKDQVERNRRINEKQRDIRIAEVEIINWCKGLGYGSDGKPYGTGFIPERSRLLIQKLAEAMTRDIEKPVSAVSEKKEM